MYFSVRAMVFVVLWPMVSFAESTFSTPAGVPNSSSGFSVPAGAATNGPVISPSGFSTPAGAATNTVVRGEVTKVDGDSYVIRDPQGQELRIQPAKDARIDHLPRSGDQIEVQLTNGRATSITRGSGSGSAGSANK